MKRICCLASAGAIALLPAATALATPGPGDRLPPEYTVEQGLTQTRVVPATKEEVARTARTPVELAAIKGSTACWQHHWRYARGSFVYHRAVNQQTFWCSDWRVITYRSTSTWPDTGQLCSTMWGPQSWVSGGGGGSWHVDVTSRGGFRCWVNWFDYHDWIQFTIRYTYYGSSYSV
jgi:hypothetical protein